MYYWSSDMLDIYLVHYQSQEHLRAIVGNWSARSSGIFLGYHDGNASTQTQQLVSVVVCHDAAPSYWEHGLLTKESIVLYGSDLRLSQTCLLWTNLLGY